MFSGKLVFFPFQRNIRFENLFTIHDGGYDVSLGDLLDVIVQEVAVEHCHVGNLAELDRTQTMLLMELTGDVDSHGTQRLLAGDGFLQIAWGCCRE